MANIIALVEPEIPYNTGNIARTCVSTGSELHLVRPMKFSISDKYIRKAGMDYWDEVRLTVWEGLAEFMEFLEDQAQKNRPIYYATTKGQQTLAHLQVPTEDAIIVFGKESAGLPEEMLAEHPERCFRIPMAPDNRSLNLSNSVAIFLYEVLRQQGYPQLI